MSLRFGIFGYLDNHLVNMIGTDGGYEFYTQDEYIISKYGFNVRKSIISDYISYRLPAKENTGISAFKVHSFARYQGFDLYIENCDDKILLVAPLDDDAFFKVYPRRICHKGWYDPRDLRFEIGEEEVTDIWEERTPIKGFKFDVEPMVYLKKDGIWLTE